ncbi:glutathione reductase [Ligilactobacillus salitolerans]|uniref:Glutathione reductase n=1 Tax=Ligilactobacillus salitolerans TaxID=1808352 RepID=A0A401IPX5_9LACO|nr:NAD(P)/FAD-dependent oxidoreductase [Ligilactobacillus salitolerans]GBG93560.1 glutathione reductase [Ligilactobacillus salitolerans]
MAQATEKYAAVIIGAGPAGNAAASTLKAQGKTVAIVEEDLWGGTCPNRGCDPKKILYAAVEAKQRAALFAGAGLDAKLKTNWPELMANKRAYTREISPSTKGSLANSGIKTYMGHANFSSPTTLEVGGHHLEAENFIIATGQRPRLLEIPGKEFLQTSTDFLDLDNLPQDITIIGGGYVAFELAGIAAAAGSQVTVVLYNDRPLKAFPKQLVDKLVVGLEKLAVHFVYNQDLAEVKKTAPGFQVVGKSGYTHDTNAVFAAVGRQPNVDQLGLTQAGVEYSRFGVIVDRHLRSTAAHIYAVGDAAASPVPKLTPTAGYEAKYVAEQIAGNDAEISYPAVPTTVFSFPKLAQVGLTEDEALKDPARYRVKTTDVSSWITYKRQHESETLVQIIEDKLNDQVVGAACLSMEADEMINYLTLLIGEQYSAQKLRATLFAYPTTASDLQYLY